jgi:hypothetical protein
MIKLAIRRSTVKTLTLELARAVGGLESAPQPGSDSNINQRCRDAGQFSSETSREWIPQITARCVSDTYGC